MEATKTNKEASEAGDIAQVVQPPP
jgi:hypothetical protein